MPEVVLTYLAWGIDLVTVVKIALVCTGVNLLLKEGNALAFVGRKLEACPWWMNKPLGLCLPCMASLYTILGTGTINIPMMLAVCGLNTLIDAFLGYIENTPQAEYDKSREEAGQKEACEHEWLWVNPEDNDCTKRYCEKCGYVEGSAE